MYLAVLSMVMMIVSAPAAMAQQGGGTCADPTLVDSFSGNTNVFETEPFDIDTETFQVAIDTTSGSEFGFTSVTVFDTNATAIDSADVDAGESTVFNVANNGAGPFDLSISTSEQSYDITVSECGAVPDVPETTMEETTIPEMEETTVPEMEETTVPEMEETMGAGDVQYEEETTEDTEGMTALPDTGGPSVLLIGATLLMGSGILGLAVLRRRSE
jgi:hypothetical protein